MLDVVCTPNGSDSTVFQRIVMSEEVIGIHDPLMTKMQTKLP